MPHPEIVPRYLCGPTINMSNSLRVKKSAVFFLVITTVPSKLHVCDRTHLMMLPCRENKIHAEHRHKEICIKIVVNWSDTQVITVHSRIDSYFLIPLVGARFKTDSTTATRNQPQPQIMLASHISCHLSKPC